MEPLLPPKDEVLNYLNNEGPEPMVKAKVCIKGIIFGLKFPRAKKWPPTQPKFASLDPPKRYPKPITNAFHPVTFCTCIDFNA